MTPNSRESKCSVCRDMFVTEESFDLHRGIQQLPRRADAQDAGRCLPHDERVTSGMTLVADRWGTKEEHDRAARFASMRDQRGKTAEGE